MLCGGKWGEKEERGENNAKCSYTAPKQERLKSWKINLINGAGVGCYLPVACMVLDKYILSSSFTPQTWAPNHPAERGLGCLPQELQMCFLGDSSLSLLVLVDGLE